VSLGTIPRSERSSLSSGGLLKNADTLRILANDINPELAPRPVHKVLLASIAVIVAATIRQLVLRITAQLGRDRIMTF